MINYYNLFIQYYFYYMFIMIEIIFITLNPSLSIKQLYIYIIHYVSAVMLINLKRVGRCDKGMKCSPTLPF